MAILRVDDVSKYFGTRRLFSEISFEISDMDHVGLVGVNGCGKTTLFRMLCGGESADTGSIGFSKECKIAYLEQTLPCDNEDCLFDAVLSCNTRLLQIEEQLEQLALQISDNSDHLEKLVHRQSALHDEYEQNGGLTFRNRTRSVLLGLGFTQDELQISISALSGGQLRKAALAKILLSDANLLLLDEPTNHLDIPSVEWLEDFLLSYRGAYIVISHDRYFLDQVTTKTLEIENGKLSSTNGNYSRHVELKMDEREIAMRHYLNTQQEIKRIESIIEQQRRWNQARNYVTIASKQKQIDRLKEDLIKPEADPKKIAFHFRPAEVSGNDVLIATGLKKAFGTNVLFSNANLHVLKNEKVCIIGANGCGKTTFLKVLTSLIQPDTGTFSIGANVHIGYYEQSMQSLAPEKTIIDELSDSFPRLDHQQLRNMLAIFLFCGDDVFKKIDSLSGGEMARIQLLKLMLSCANFLILDEPTNHLDIASREALESSLLEYGGTMLIVTHDRYLINRIADRILILDGDGLHPFSGDWNDYKTAIVQEMQQNKKEKNETPKNEYIINKERKIALAKCKAEGSRIEKMIAQEEYIFSQLQSGLDDPSISSNYEKSAELYRNIEEQRAKVDTLYEKWEEYAAELSTYDGGENQ